MVADGHGNLRTHGFQSAQHGRFCAVHHNHLAVLSHLGQDAVKQVVVIIPIFTVHIVVAQFKLHLFGQFGKQGVLGFGRQFREHQIALRLPFAPDVFERAGIKHRKGHEVHRIKALLVVVEVALRILHAGVFLALLKHPARLQAGKADFLFHTGNHHDQPFFHNLVVRSGKRQQLFQYLAAVIRVSYNYCHSSITFYVCP